MTVIGPDQWADLIKTITSVIVGFPSNLARLTYTALPCTELLTSFSLQDETWAEFSTSEVSVCMLCGVKLPNLKLKTRPKQLLDSLPLDMSVLNPLSL